MRDLIDAFAQLRSFDHAACDQALRASGMTVLQRITMNRGSAYDQLYVASAFLGLSFLFVLALTMCAWRAPVPHFAALR